jgi:hypothetical protein
MVTFSLGIIESTLLVSLSELYLMSFLGVKRLERSAQQYVEALNKETNSTFPKNS